jgi:type III secretory pathway component EscS
MEQKRSVGIIVTSITLFLFLFIAWAIADVSILFITERRLSWTLFEFIKRAWYGLIFYVILGFGIFKLNNKVRLITIAWMTSIGIAGPLGLMVGIFMSRTNIQKILSERFGVSVITLPWLIIVPISLICFSIVYFLTRPKVKEQFR